MTTISESQRSIGATIDAIADAAVALSDWSEPETGEIQNDQSSTTWDDNGRLLYNSNMGQYVLLYCTFGDNFQGVDCGNNQSSNIGGIRIVLSNDWNSTDVHPAGKTTVVGNNSNRGDPFGQQVANNVKQSYDSTNFDYQYDADRDGPATGLWFIGGDTNSYSSATIDDRVDASNLVNVTGFGSVTNNHLCFGTWNTDDGTNGSAGTFGIEYVDTKFWTDGVEPFMFHCKNCNANNYGNHGYMSGYGYEGSGQRGQRDSGQGAERIIRGHIFDSAKWGFINPDANDDTYFFQRPVAYSTGSKQVPSAFLYHAIRNDLEGGGAHGDIVTYDGDDHRIFQQSGNATNTDLPVGLLYI